MVDDQGSTEESPYEMPPFRSQIREQLPRTYEESANILEAVGAIFDQDFLTSTLIRDLQSFDDSNEPDAEWDSYDNDRLREMFQEYEIPMTRDFIRNYRNTFNENHARRVLDRTKAELRNSETLRSFFGDASGAEFITRLGLSMFDPVGWAAGGVAGRLATSGLRARKAAALAEAAERSEHLGSLGDQLRAATAMTPVTTRGRFAARSALAAGAVDGSLEAYHVQRSPTAGQDEAFIAGLGSLAIGGVYGALGFRSVDIELARRAQVQGMERTVREAFGEPEVQPSSRPQDPFSGSSVGATRVANPEEPQAPETAPNELVTDFDPGQSTSFGNNIRFDAYAQFNRSQSAHTRALGSILFVDGAGSRAREGRAQHFTVEEIAHQHERVHTNRFAEQTLAAWDSWKQSQGISTRESAMNAEHYNDFINQVARAVRGDPTVNVTPEIAQVRDSFRESMRLQLQEAKRRGVLLDVEENDLYVPRFWRRDAFIGIMKRYGETRGKDILAMLIGRSLRGVSDDLEKADDIARHVIDVVVYNRVSQDVLNQISNMGPQKAAEKLRDFLPSADNDTLNALVQLFSKGRTRAADGPRAESRLDLDENAELFLGGKRFRLSDLLNNDLLSVNTIYSRQIGGRIAFSDVTDGRLKTTDDIEAFLQEAESSISGLENADLEHESRLIEQIRAYSDYLLGHGSLAEGGLTENQQAFMKFLRDVSFARLMGQVGYAQLSEMGTAIGALGLRNFMAHAPAALRRVMSNYRPGTSESDDHLIQSLADMTGLGNMHIQARMRTLSRELDSEDVYGARDTTPGDRGPNGPARSRMGEAVNTAYRGAELWARGTSILGGLQPMTDMFQYTTATGMLASFARNHREGRRLVAHRNRGFSEKRMLAMGITEEWEDRIKQLFDEVSVYDDNGILRDLRIADASDQGAVEHLFRVVLRETRRIIQEGDLGTSRAEITGPLFRTLLQFKTFVMNSHVKQMLYGANMRDAQLGTEYLASVTFAGIGQLAKYQLMTAGMSSDDRRDYLEYAYGQDDQYVGAAMSAIRYSSHVGLLPDAIDTLTSMALGERYFDYRNTGLSSGFLDPEGTAAWNTITSPLRVIEELKEGEPDDAVRDALRVGPNYVPLVALGNVLQRAVPDKIEQ